MLNVKKIRTNKLDYLEMLLLGDHDEAHIRSCIEACDLYVMQNELGLTSCIALIQKDKDHCEIINLATDPKYRKHGIASKLIAYLVGVYENKFSNFIIHIPNDMVAIFETMGFFTQASEHGVSVMCKYLKEDNG